MSKAIIIGSGISGLATAVSLATKGWQVLVFESNAYPGGKLSQFEIEGYRFDAGPSLFTLPNLVTEVIESAGKKVGDYFNFVQCEEACRYFWEDGTRLTAWSDSKAFAQEVQDKLNEPSVKVIRYLEESAKLYKNTHSLFLESSLHKWQTYFNKEVFSALFNLHSLHLTENLHAVNAKRFKNPKLVQLFDRFATYNGSSPFLTPGVMQIIPHLEHNVGTFYPKGGMHSITEALFSLVKDLGVEFVFNSKVDEILVNNKQVTGVKVGGKSYLSDLVVSNADVYPTYRQLLPKEKAPEKILKQERSSSAFIFYWGISKSFQELGLHNIFFSNDYRSEFNSIFKEKSIPTDPTIYINISSKETETDAPKDSENWFVMVNTPGDYGQDWEQIRAELRLAVIQKLNGILKTDIEPFIEVEEVLTPPLIESKTSSYKGALYGSASNDAMSAFLRHPNFSRKLKGLYFAGGSAHPGGGIPLCLLSARITTDIINEDYAI
jgi:diapolycopene oxygenase